MNILNTEFTMLYLIGMAILIWTTLYVRSQSSRARQWLITSSLIGVGIGPLAWLTTSSSDALLERITMLSGSAVWVELALLSGLLWGIAATLPGLFTREQGIPLPIRVDWLKLFSFYGLYLVSALIANSLQWSTSLGILAGLGLLAVTLLTLNPARLKPVGINAAASIILIGGVAWALTFFSPKLTQYQLIAGISSPLNLTTIFLLVILSLLAPVASWWWFKQPINSLTANPRLKPTKAGAL